jgi:hypothetical protein
MQKGPEVVKAIELRLASAQERMSRASKAIVSKPRGGEREEFKSAYDDLLVIERELAAAKDEEHAIPFDFPVKWDVGAPSPHIVANEGRTYLTFYIRDADPNWDGTYVTIRNPGDSSTNALALVEFENCSSFRMGAPNDEVQHGHRLYGRGLQGYTAQIVQNSSWIKELQLINSVHYRYDPANWVKLTHYIFWFHDTTFECVTKSIKVEIFQESMSSLLAKICSRVLRE